jgi:hypothetical protein
MLTAIFEVNQTQDKPDWIGSGLHIDLIRKVQSLTLHFCRNSITNSPEFLQQLVELIGEHSKPKAKSARSIKID